MENHDRRRLTGEQGDGRITKGPTIIINGIMLSDAQATAMRGAIMQFYSEMNDPYALGEDEIGMSIAKGYKERAAEILALMTRSVS